MVESEAERLSEAVMLGAVVYGHEQMQVAIRAIRELAAEAGKPAWQWSESAGDAELAAAVAAQAEAELTKAYALTEKQARYTRIAEVKAAVVAALAAGETPKFDAKKVSDELGRLEYNLVRRKVLAGERRIDGRDMRTVRPITVETGVLPRTHGSALFTRGETQALVTTTLGTGRDAQIIDALSGERKEPFMLHYNFPPFSVNEVSMQLAPKRREIGHGNLARRGISAVMPDMTTFPYVIRVVSEILESNGSSSMASVCGTSLALMDAGVPVKAPVAGVAMGLVLEGGQVPGPHRHPRRRGSPRRHGFQGGRHRRWRHRAADGHQDRGDHQGDHEGRPRPGPRGAPAHPRRDGQGAVEAARDDVRVGPDHHHDEDRPGEDPRSHRQGRRRHPGNHGRDGHHHRHRERRHGEDRLGRSAPRAARRSGASS